jgi:hypothetical protein
MTSFDVDKFYSPPRPPRYLYKYLSAERAGNVLEGGTVRFAQLLDTNDTFEVRSTFNKLAGPKMLAMLAEQMDNTLSEDSLRKLTADMLKENGLGWLPADLAIKLAEQHYGGNFIGLLRSQMQHAVDRMLVPHFNDPENAKKLLEKLGQDLLCFSLSERMDSPPMWAHYARNNTGFVVAFDTEHAWFRQRKSGERTRLQKVAYFDGKLDEPLENPQAAFISKTTDWAYEREWRLYIKNGEADLIVGSAEAPIQLLEFPPEAVDRVILGAKMRPEMVNRIREVMANRYPHATITRAVPNRESHTYDEVPE